MLSVCTGQGGVRIATVALQRKNHASYHGDHGCVALNIRDTINLSLIFLPISI